MSTLNERIKQIRRTLNLTQQGFAERIGIKRNTVATYEMGRSTPSDSALSLICREFGISREWLETGQGEMFAQRAYQIELTEIVERMLTGETADFKRRLIQMLSGLKEDQWKVLEEKAREIAAAPSPAIMRHPEPSPEPSAPPAPVPSPAPDTDMATAFAALQRQNAELLRQNAEMLQRLDSLEESMSESEKLLGLSDTECLARQPTGNRSP